MSDAERLKSTMTIGKAISLMKNKHSCEMVERHVRALSRIANNNKTGFLLKELGDLCELLRTCADRLHTFPEYEEPLCRIVGLCSLPFLKERSSDENVYAPCVIETMVLLGELAKLRSDLLRAQVARAVSAFYSTEPDPAHIEGLQMTRLSFNATLVERSSIVKSLVEALQLTEDLHTQMALLHTLQLLSTTATNCNHMLSVGAAHLICDALEEVGSHFGTEIRICDRMFPQMTGPECGQLFVNFSNKYSDMMQAWLDKPLHKLVDMPSSHPGQMADAVPVWIPQLGGTYRQVKPAALARAYALIARGYNKVLSTELKSELLGMEPLDSDISPFGFTHFWDIDDWEVTDPNVIERYTKTLHTLACGISWDNIVDENRNCVCDEILSDGSEEEDNSMDPLDFGEASEDWKTTASDDD